jgi:hypothetical protein
MKVVIPTVMHAYRHGMGVAFLIVLLMQLFKSVSCHHKWIMDG